MFLVSTAKSTKLSDFADLETISKYQHKNSESTDFQFCTNSQVFVEVNKQNGIEVMRIKEVSESVTEIQRVRKLKIENVYCVACSRQSTEEIALGLTNGQVKLYNYRNSEMLHRYIGAKLNSIIFLDYNVSDEYISAVYENGVINVYGTKTHVKMEAINIDSNSTLARFHPSKRFCLAIASAKGSVSTYDISAKRKLFHLVDSHSAPCRDLSMSAASPDLLYSVGFDCHTNIYDTRRKSQIFKLQHNHPLSTVATSDCGTFFCVGSLKGELSTYDMRNTKSHLSNKKVHNTTINRVAFVPQTNNIEPTFSLSTPLNATLSGGSSEETNNKQQPIENIESFGNSIAVAKSSVMPSVRRDSFCDFMDFQMGKGIGKMDKTSNRFSTVSTRDSFDWEALKRKSSTDNRGSLCTKGRYSFGDSFDSNIINTDLLGQDLSAKTQASITPNTLPLRERNIFPQYASTPADKPIIIEDKELQEQNAIDTNVYSTPIIEKDNPSKHLEVPKPVFSTPVGVTPANMETPIDNTPILKKVLTQIDDLRSQMDGRFERLESELKYNAERNKWEIFTQASNLWFQQIDNTEEIRSALTVLLQTDPFVVEYKRLKEENQQLKSQLERLSFKK